MVQIHICGVYNAVMCTHTHNCGLVLSDLTTFFLLFMKSKCSLPFYLAYTISVCVSSTSHFVKNVSFPVFIVLSKCVHMNFT